MAVPARVNTAGRRSGSTMPEHIDTRNLNVSQAIDKAKAFLTHHGYVVLKEKSYRLAQERQRVAEVYRKCAEEDAQRARTWAQTELHNDIRDLYARCTYLYGVARAKGASAEELSGGWTPTGINIPAERASTIKCHCGTYPFIIKEDGKSHQFICPKHGWVASTRVEVNDE